MKGRKKKTRNPRVQAACLLFMGLFIAELLFYTWCRVQCTQIKYAITKQARIVQQLAAMQDNLKIELARLKSPRRIAKIAREQLGLISPGAQHTIVLP